MTTPTPQEVHRSLSQRREQAIQTAFVAKIVEYDHGLQTATIQPEQSEVWRDAKNVRTVSGPFRIYDVPVLFPAGGGFSITFPINVGDFVLVTCTKYSLSRWREGIAGDPGDMRRFSLDGAVAHPVNLYQRSNAISNTESGFMILSAGGTARLLALAHKIVTELNDIRVAMNTHKHGDGTLISDTQYRGPGPVVEADLATTKVKAE